MNSGCNCGLLYTDFLLFDLPCHWLVGRFGRRGRLNEVEKMRCRDGKLRLVWSYEWRWVIEIVGERERERVCCCAVWQRTGWRKESYSVGVPHTQI